ncbi:MAG: hypothetical protein WA117_24250 [Verrucomicrobiia bacterium]
MTRLEPDLIETLLARLQKTRTWKHNLLLSIGPLALLFAYGIFQWQQNEHFLPLVTTIFLVVVCVEIPNAQIRNKQLNLLVEMVEELHKAGKISTAERKMYATSPTRQNLL